MFTEKHTMNSLISMRAKAYKEYKEAKNKYKTYCNFVERAKAIQNREQMRAIKDILFLLEDNDLEKLSKEVKDKCFFSRLNKELEFDINVYDGQISEAVETDEEEE